MRPPRSSFISPSPLGAAVRRGISTAPPAGPGLIVQAAGRLAWPGARRCCRRQYRSSTRRIFRRAPKPGEGFTKMPWKPLELRAVREVYDGAPCRRFVPPVLDQSCWPALSEAASTQNADPEANLEYQMPFITDPGMVYFRFGSRRTLVPIPKMWLRDACQCERCVNPATGRKTFATCDVPAVPEVQKVGHKQGNFVHIYWQNDFMPDDNGVHHSIYSSHLLADCTLLPAKTMWPMPARHFWDKHELESSINRLSTPYNNWITAGPIQAHFFNLFLEWGLLIVNDVPKSKLNEVTKPLGPAEFLWIANEQKRILSEARYAGLQQDVPDSETGRWVKLIQFPANARDQYLLVSDGVRAAHQLRQQNPAHFTTLAHTHVHSLAQGRVELGFRSPVIRLRPNSAHPERVMWSPTSQLPFPHYAREYYIEMHDFGWGKLGKAMREWREAARAFRDILDDRDANVFEYPVRPGDVVLLDNSRLAHRYRADTDRLVVDWTSGLQVAYVAREAVQLRYNRAVEKRVFPPPVGMFPYVREAAQASFMSPAADGASGEDGAAGEDGTRSPVMPPIVRSRLVEFFPLRRVLTDPLPVESYRESSPLSQEPADLQRDRQETDVPNADEMDADEPRPDEPRAGEPRPDEPRAKRDVGKIMEARLRQRAEVAKRLRLRATGGLPTWE